MEFRKLKRVLVLDFSASGGGAHVAAARIHKALVKFGPELMIESSLRTIRATETLPQSTAGYPRLSGISTWLRGIQIFFRRAKQWLYRCLGGDGLFSSASIRTGLAEEISNSRPDLVIVNWLGDFTEAIEAFQMVHCPIMVRTADFWFLGGSSHLPEYVITELQTWWSRFVDRLFFGLGENRARRAKTRFLEEKVQAVIAPSRWMKRQVEQDVVLSAKTHYVIPNPLDTSFWRPTSTTHFQNVDSQSRPVRLLFGAIGGTRYPWKGGDLLRMLSDELASLVLQKGAPMLELHTFGGKAPRLNARSIPVFAHGRLGPKRLRELYSSADFFLQTSRVETFGNTVLEAMACGTPVAAFDVGPMAELVQNGVTGVIVPPYDTKLLAAEILRCVDSPAWMQNASHSSRSYVMQSFSESLVARQYAEAIHRQSP